MLMGFILSACSGPDICDCEQEANQINPDRELMQSCERIYQGKDFEAIEAELAKCKEKQ